MPTSLGPILPVQQRTFAAGAAFGGAKYEYADSYNLTATKPKYKGKELQKLQSEGVHVIVVNKKTASAEMESARNSCKSSTTPSAPQAAQAAQAAQAPAVQAPAVTPVLSPVKANAPVCVASSIDTDGKEICTQYSRQ